MCNTYCFSTATMVMRTRLFVTLYVHCFCCLYSKCSTIFRCRSKLNFSYSLNTSTTLRSPIAKVINDQQLYVRICHTGFHPHRTVVVQSADGDSFMPVSEVWLSLCRFSLNYFLPDGITLRSPIPHFTWICQNIWKVWVEVHWLFTQSLPVLLSIVTKLKVGRRLLVKNSHTKFHENPTSGLVGDTRSQTDGRDFSAHKSFSFKLQITRENYEAPRYGIFSQFYVPLTGS